MSISYGPLARWYDKLTRDVPYDDFADFYERLIAENGGERHTLLDLCCGTGTLTDIMARRGYEMIACDGSEDMLLEAQGKASGAEVPPLFLHQEASRLDLYGTVDAAYCSLDGMDYIPPEELEAVFSRLHLFIRPYGLFIFDIRTPESMKSLDGQIFVDESDDVLCLWRADFDETDGTLCYGMDIFSRRGRLWQRDCEEHIEYAHSPEELERKLISSGFEDVKLYPDCPQCEQGRLFISARNTNIY